MNKWKDVVGHEGSYMVCENGDIKSASRIASDGRRIYERILKPQKYSNGYLFVSFRKDGVTFQKMIHRVVMEAFIGVSDLVVNHKDFNKENNQLENLEYCTQRDNMIHCFKSRKTSSVHNGISWNKRAKKWEVKIMYKYKNHYFGRYVSEQEAIKIHAEKLKELHES